jgi:hypothetical protein
MRRRTSSSSFDTVRAIARVLPDTEEGTAWGTPAIKLRGRLLACLASNKAAEPNTLVVCVSFDQRDAMIAGDPDTYYLKDHYVAYPCVLVRLSKVHPDALRDLLQAGWRFVDAAAPRRRAGATRRKTTPPGPPKRPAGSRSRR